MDKETSATMHSSEGTSTTLCQPDSEKSCFFCCPPLRAYGYDPLRKRFTLEPTFRRNRERFLSNSQASSGMTPRPINGWDCWGLGYLDEEEKKVGCLLHPSQHNGKDYRYLVGYEGKCAREMCLEAKTFEALTERAQNFFLSLTSGMDSFEYSSREGNPIFPVLLWGRVVGEKIVETEGFQRVHRDEFKKRYDPFFTIFSYKTDGYLVESLIEKIGLPHFKKPSFLEHYKEWKEALLQKHCIHHPSSQVSSGINPSSRPVHLFDVPLSFSRFLKFSLNLWIAPEEQVSALKKAIDDEIERFIYILSKIII